MHDRKPRIVLWAVIFMTALSCMAGLNNPPAGGGGGEVNTASNLGTGLGIWRLKSGVDLQFNSVTGSSPILVTLIGSNLTWSVDSSLVFTNTAAYVAGLTDLVAGANVTITGSGRTRTIAASGGGGAATTTNTLTISGINVTNDHSLGNHFVLNLTTNAVLLNPLNPVEGFPYTYEIRTHTNAIFTLTLSNAFTFGSSLTSYSVTTDSNKVDYITVKDYINGSTTNCNVVGASKGFAR